MANESDSAKTVTIKGFVYEYDHYSEGDPAKYSFYSSDTHGSTYCTLVGPAEFQFTIPATFNRTASRLAALERDKSKVRAAYLAKVKEIEEQISKLSAIEFVEA